MERNLSNLVKGAVAGIIFTSVIGGVSYYSKYQEKSPQNKVIKIEKYEYKKEKNFLNLSPNSSTLQSSLYHLFE